MFALSGNRSMQQLRRAVLLVPRRTAAATTKCFSTSTSNVNLGAAAGAVKSAKVAKPAAATNVDGKATTSSSSSKKISPKLFYEKLKQHNVNFYTGVPDSLLKDFTGFLTDEIGESPNSGVISANEGTALATACGYHLASGEIPLVYLQNSGYGNIINPLLSLSAIYDIPVLFLIGWRGEPGVKDEPQHNTMGRLQLGLLDAVELDYGVLPFIEENSGGGGDIENLLDESIEKAMKVLKSGKSYAMVVKKNSFEKYKPKEKEYGYGVGKAANDIQTAAMGEAKWWGNDASSSLQNLLYTASQSKDIYLTREKALEKMLPWLKTKSNKEYPTVGTTGPLVSFSFSLEMPIFSSF